METVELAPEQWYQFCSEISRRHRGERVDVRAIATRLLEQVAGAEGAAQSLSRDVPLHGLSLEATGPGRTLTISAGAPPRHLDHRVVGPVRLLLERAEEGVRGLRIDGGNGQSTLVRFRVPVMAEEVDGATPQ